MRVYLKTSLRQSYTGPAPDYLRPTRGPLEARIEAGLGEARQVHDRGRWRQKGQRTATGSHRGFECFRAILRGATYGVAGLNAFCEGIDPPLPPLRCAVFPQGLQHHPAVNSSGLPSEGNLSGKGIAAKARAKIHAMTLPPRTPSLMPLDYAVWQRIDKDVMAGAPQIT